MNALACWSGQGYQFCDPGSPSSQALLEHECLAAEEVLGFLDEDVASHIGDGIGERDALGADLDAVLGVAALLDAAISGKRSQAFFREDLTGWVVVEELHLGDSGGA